MQNDKLNYINLRTEINNIFIKFYSHELECSKAEEFDSEWLEYRTNDILRLIRKQGGSIDNAE